MATNDFKAFASGVGANVTEQDVYAALAVLSTGFQSGTAKSDQVNKALRQGTIGAALLGQFIVEHAGLNAVDDGTVETLVSNFASGVLSVAQQATAALSASLSTQNGAGQIGFIQGGVGAILRTLYQKALEHITIDDYGNVAGGTADATSAVADALALAPAGGVIDTLGKSYLVTALANAYGTRFTGGGKLLIADSHGGNLQLNSYSDDGKTVVGREYRAKLFKRLKAGGNLGVFIYGDSTAATAGNGGGYAGAAFEPQVLLANLLQAKGVRNTINITNRAVGGTGIADINPLPDIDSVGDTSDVFIIKTLINDASLGLATTVTNLRAKLAAIRSHAHGDYESLTVIIVGPNATYETSTGRASPWYESLRGMLLEAARDFQCLYIDTYAYLRHDGPFATGVTMNLDYPQVAGDLRNVHPLEPMQLWIWSLVADAMITDTEIVAYTSDAWVVLPLQDGWTSYGGGAATPAYRISRNGDVWLRGVIAGGTIGAGRTIAQLPAGAAPLAGELFPGVVQSGGSCGIRVANSGAVQQADGNANATYTSLSGICFSTR
ncbi:SGNH/GDSL hydrolase family protein [Burkholderia arboris]|uniref:SGNH/GDSL hydrolase family protein n=1 Tax=Burkholderia arboris TaxID=488730 RepID=UPI001CF5B6EC|nr:SGNH/GDSL hydrolase family protein [Burkholderia arboris]MCA8492546.1 hypothetical protein [Burkholderia arboris]